MSKKKKLVKEALKKPWLYSMAEIFYFRRWLQQRKLRKAAKIQKNEAGNS